MIKLLLLISLPFSLFANDCHSLKETRTRLNISSFNYLNANTTRTEEGGTFLIRKISKCKKGKCEISKGTKEYDTMLKYEPDHPDASKIGYVRYPNLDIKKEWAIINSRAHHMLLLAEKGACKTSLNKTKNLNFYEVTYEAIKPKAGLVKVETEIAHKVETLNSFVKSDKLLFAEGKLKSWEVEYQDGTTTITSF